MDLPLSVPAPPVGVLGLWGWRAASSEALGAVAPTCGDSGAWCSLGWSLVGFAGVVDDSELPDFVPWWAELSFETVEHYVDFFFIFFLSLTRQVFCIILDLYYTEMRVPAGVFAPQCADTKY